MFNGKEISWKHIKGVYDHTIKHATAQATKLTKHHIWLTSWSKMRVDLAEHTISKEVEDALASIDELKKISEGTREFIKYSRKYRQIMHSKIGFQSLEDPRINTLKEIYNWFVDDAFHKDMLEELFGNIRELGRDSSTHTLKSYGHALNKYQVTALVSSEVKSINYGKADSTGAGITTLERRDYRKDKKISVKNDENITDQKHFIRLAQLSSLFSNVFKNLFADNLIMGRIEIPDLVSRLSFITNLNDSPTQRLVAYLLLQNVIKLTFSKKTTPNSIHTHFSADSYLEPEKILVLEPAEALKFSYIIGWVIYKLTKK
ncbi:hypothetical protein GLOIN_2v1776914 [Rhizophagus irregularis DAOM 181602=DAOM 197198]|nr:hypothetical protein GLOIN_2v1776914 [Rhizophagus irregularis DAOM 181602=DAOM 197198]